MPIRTMNVEMKQIVTNLETAVNPEALELEEAAAGEVK